MSEVRKPLSVVQLALNTRDMPGTLRLYSELFGFRNAGASALWGELARLQGLPPEARTLIWWMIGAQPFFQLEIFQHTEPQQRPLPADWKPNDHGWVRFGVRVAKYDRVREGLMRWGIAIIGESESTPHRRLAFRDPFAGVVVEVIEAIDQPGPAIAYATSSVADADAIRRFYEDVLQLPTMPLETLHGNAAEALWGLGGAERAGFVADAGGVALEVIEYRDPRGRPRPADATSADQGIMNIGIGSRDPETVRALIARVQEGGYATTVLFDAGDAVCTYSMDPGCEFELLALSGANDAALGFEPAAPFAAEIGQPDA